MHSFRVLVHLVLNLLHHVTPTTSDLCASGALTGVACNGNNITSGPGSTMQKERMCDPATCTPQQQPDSNCNTISMVGCGSIYPNNTTSTNQPFTTQNPNTNPGQEQPINWLIPMLLIIRPIRKNAL